jgi:uncharacterized repeat protein (TIGR01451 family)
MSSKFTKLFLSAGALALLPAGQAFAAGTAAGTDVVNTFSLEYEVGGVGQTYTPDADDTVTFEVDRVVDLTVAVQTTDPLSATPGQVVEQIFEVSNDGNAPQAYALDVLQDAAGGTDDFDVTPTVVEISTDGGTTWVAYTPGDATPDVPADGSLLIRVTSTVPATQASGDTAEIAIVAETLEPATGGFGTAGDTVGGSGTNTQGGVETVLNDGTGDLGNTEGGTDGDNDGNHSDTHTIVVQNAVLAAVKEVILVSEDGSGCTTFPGGGAATTAAATSDFYIPGACVEYTITLTNTGDADADVTSLADILHEDLIFEAADTTLGGTLSAPAAATACDGTDATCEVEVTTGTVPAPVAPATSVERRLRIRARVQD